MANLIEAVTKTRGISAEIALQSLSNIDTVSEIEVHRSILSKMSTYESIFPTGWYDPPPGGVSILFDEKPFKRLQYDSLRNPAYWSSEKMLFKKEAVGSVYFSPVNKKTGMLGDIGFTLYRGGNKEIQQHIKNVYDALFAIAEHAKVGMKFSELCSFASNSFQNKFKLTRWVAVSSDPNQSINLGHSVSGLFENSFTFGNNFEEVKEAIRTKRVPIIDTENFEIPKTYVFLVESRLESLHQPHLPSAYFQFMVCFDNGEKTILEGYDTIFKTVGMGYMNIGQ